MFRSYEEYMQTLLGYNPNYNTYNRDYENYYDFQQFNQNVQELNDLYPEIYGIIYPVIQKVWSRRNLINITEENVNQMVEEVYNVIEPDEEAFECREEPLKNGDVVNPRAKENMKKPNKHNSLLKDLIRILLLREIGGYRPGFYPGEPGYFTNMPEHAFQGGPGFMPPPRPGMFPTMRYR